MTAYFPTLEILTAENAAIAINVSEVRRQLQSLGYFIFLELVKLLLLTNSYSFRLSSIIFDNILDHSRLLYHVPYYVITVNLKQVKTREK